MVRDGDGKRRPAFDLDHHRPFSELFQPVLAARSAGVEELRAAGLLESGPYSARSDGPTTTACGGTDVRRRASRWPGQECSVSAFVSRSAGHAI